MAKQKIKKKIQPKTDIIDKWLKSTYRDKGTGFSVTELLKPNYYIWVNKTMKDKIKIPEVMGLKSVVGSALHKFIEEQDEIGVVKEFSWIKEIEVDGEVYTIGGTADELRFDKEVNKWIIGDIKTKGDYPFTKFLDGERDNEIKQLSIYRWLFEGLFDIADKGRIYLFNIGYTRASTYDVEYTEVEIPLFSKESMEAYIKDKIRNSLHKEPEKDCPYWLCDYCNAKDICPKSRYANQFKNEE